jgi:hypothetical protein
VVDARVEKVLEMLGFNWMVEGVLREGVQR